MNNTRLKRLALGAASGLLALSAFAVPAFAESHTVKWSRASGADAYNIYYTPSGKGDWLYSVPMVPGSSTAYKIKGLKNGASYKYQVRVLRGGQEVATVKKGSFSVKQ